MVNAKRAAIDFELFRVAHCVRAGRDRIITGGRP
jgi:hypothetical protein